MKVLFITIAWPVTGERNLYSDLMDEFVIRGHEVVVLSADERETACKLISERNLQILKVPTNRIRKVNKLKKAVALFSLGVTLKRELLKAIPEYRADLIIAHSPPVTLSGMLYSLKRRFGARLYYLLKDIWPHGPADLGIIRKNGILFNYFRFHEKKVYRIADFIGCMSPMNRDYILRNNRFLSEEKVEVCPNTITPRRLELKNDRLLVREKHKVPPNAKVFIFSGNIGKAHGIDFYLDAISELKEFEKAFFLIGGSGQFFDHAVREIEKRNLKNIGTYSRLPAEDFDQLLLACDVGVILLDRNYSVPQFPSRLLAYLEAGKPILCSVNHETDIGEIVVNSGCGISTLNGDIGAFKQAIEYFCDDRNGDMIRKMGSNSLALLNHDYTSSCGYEIIMNHYGS
ncbi:MAG: glycosyltransferase family 4 protein [Mangrovibacterium sp.]